MKKDLSVLIRTLLIVPLLFVSPVSAQTESQAPVLPLEGDWSFQFDPDDVGIKDRWFGGHLTDTIKLPNSTATAGLGPEITTPARSMLTANRRYVGAAWYQREVDIPTAWSDRRVNLHLERVLWRSTAWVDGKAAGDPIDLLGVPHDHDLGVLTPGHHVITIRVDNREIHATGGRGHHYYEGMQTFWNGIVGKIQLKASPPVSLDLVRFFPSYKGGSVDVEVTLRNDTDHDQPQEIKLAIQDKASGASVAEDHFSATASKGLTTVKHKLTLATPPKPWDEFQPNLYTASAGLESGHATDAYSADIGFRDLGKDEYHLTINGRPLFLRSNHDGCIFPLTGYPPTDVASWKHILQIYKDHGLNGIRFHSWTPPEAAFTAADELGIYIQSEHFWCTLDANPDIMAFARQEMRASLDHYGNHPSMCYVLYGNELGGDLKAYGEWLNTDRVYDSRHQYSVAAGRRIPTADDFSEYGVKMNWAPGTDWDYSGYFAKYHLPGVPETTHELGQPATHPNWSELDKYTGVLRPLNLQKFREAARVVGVEDQSAEFQKASGVINRITYKFDIEALLRTPQSAGYGLLDMHDYPGQNEALVGWLDSFYEEKGFLKPEEFRQYGSATVPQARFPKFVYTDGEIFNAKAEIAHYGAADLKQAVVHWDFRGEDGKIVAEGNLPPTDIPVGGVTPLGAFSTPLASPTPRGIRLKLELAIAGTSSADSWDIWVFPKPGTDPEPADVKVTADPDEAVKALDQGGKVLLVANKLGKKLLSTYAAFKTPFWSVGYFGGEDSSVEGAVIQNKHPALALFPTDDVMDRQWQPLCSDFRDFTLNPTAAWHTSPPSLYDDAHGFDLSKFPATYRPIVQPVCDFHFPHKVGTVFEVRTKAGGRLLVSGYNLMDHLADSPAARQLRHSLLTYMGSAAFAPQQEVENDWIQKTFAQADRPIPMPAGFETAMLYVKAGGADPDRKGGWVWKADVDQVSSAGNAPTYTVQCRQVWSDDVGTAWVGDKIRIELKIKDALAGTLKVHFLDWNHAGRRGIVRSVDGQEQTLGAHEDGQWLSFVVRREDSLEGKLFIEAETTAGPNLMISEMAFVP